MTTHQHLEHLVNRFSFSQKDRVVITTHFKNINNPIALEKLLTYLVNFLEPELGKTSKVKNLPFNEICKDLGMFLKIDLQLLNDENEKRLTLENSKRVLKILLWNIFHPIAKSDYKEYEISINELDKSLNICLLYTSPSPRDATLSRMPSSA